MWGTIGSWVHSFVAFWRATPQKKKTRRYLTIFDMTNNEAWVSNLEIIAKAHDNMGMYKFYRPDGSVMPIDLSDGHWRIIEQEIEV